MVYLRARYSEALNIDVPLEENGGNSGQKPQVVFGVNRYGISFFLHVFYFNRMSDTLAPLGIIGNTFSSISTTTSRK